MAKRFVDSRRYQDPWFRKLPPLYKCFWDYILNTCNHAGIWKVDFEMAEFCIGQEILAKQAISLLVDRVSILSQEKWFIPKFVEFQYGELNPENRCHKSVLDTLLKEGAYKGLTRPLEGCKDKDKDKDIYPYTDQFELLWNKYPKKKGRKNAFKHFKASVKTDTDLKKINKALDNYVLETANTDDQYIKHGGTWFHEWEDWVDHEPKNSAPPMRAFGGVKK